MNDLLTNKIKNENIKPIQVPLNYVSLVLAFAMKNKALHAEIAILNWHIENNVKFLMDDEFNIGCNWDDGYYFKNSWLDILEKKEFKSIKEKYFGELLNIIISA